MQRKLTPFVASEDLDNESAAQKMHSRPKFSSVFVRVSSSYYANVKMYETPTESTGIRSKASFNEYMKNTEAFSYRGPLMVIC